MNLDLTRRTILGGVAAAIIGRAQAQDETAIAETASGRIRGKRENGVHIFKGVPYGAPTTGRRFLPSAKPQPWTNVRDAFEYGPRAFQFRTDGPVNRSQPESEDCLVLNVWTPGLRDNGKRPVMFWCHDGGFAYGAGASPRTDGTNLARKHDVVVVTINHRLNIFGYLYLGEAGGSEFAESGNAGMMDIVLALHWVKDNIANFGGDPNNVTIFGQSGGGSKVSCLMAMPAARGLFHKAIVQSGSGIRMIEREPAAATAAEALAAAGLGKHQVRELQQIRPERLLEVAGAITHFKGGVGTSGPQILRPVVDARVLPTHPFDPVAPRISASIPMIVGTTAQETDLIYREPPLDEAAMRAKLKDSVGDASDRLIEGYRKWMPGVSPTDLYVAISTDGMRMRAITQSERKAALGKAPVYMYLFQFQHPVQKAFHTIDIPFAFDNVDLNKNTTGSGPESYQLADRHSRAWVAFARTGNPGHAGIPEWPAFDAGDRRTMLIDKEWMVEGDPLSEGRRLMRAAGI